MTVDPATPAPDEVSATGEADGEPHSTSRIQLSARVHHAINVALWANHVPLLSELTLLNETEERLGDVEVEITSTPPALLPRRWRLAEVGPGQMRVVDDLDLKLDGRRDAPPAQHGSPPEAGHVTAPTARCTGHGQGFLPSPLTPPRRRTGSARSRRAR
jgi:hypothetical protein